MTYVEILSKPNTRVLMLGNVAIARGFLEAGVQLATAYPGTPSSEIVESLAYFSKYNSGRPYVEWSINEKVALEVALGAAISGARAITAMKHVGLNVAADPLFSSAYIGVDGALVIVSADDPWMWSSQNEQDNRWYGLHAYVPVIEPTGVQDAKEAAKLALTYSWKYKKPFLLRSVTRISHTRAPIIVGEIDYKKLELKGKFRKDPSKWTVVPANARRHRVSLLEFWDKINYDFASFPLNRVEGNGDIAVVGVGIGYRFVKEAVEVLELYDNVTLFKIATPVPLSYPLAEEILSYEKILGVEEGDPIVELQIRNCATKFKSRVQIYGKETGNLPLRRFGELSLSEVIVSLAKLTKRNPPKWALYDTKGRQQTNNYRIPSRPPVLCPGCPYRSFFYAVRRAVNKTRVSPVYSGDIGCYSLLLLPPFRMQDTIINMGASIGAGQGIAKTISGDNNITIAIIGDSTFFHTGIPALINAVYNSTPILVIVLDNYTTAMTGHQPHPGIGLSATGSESPRILIEEIAKGIGLEKILVADSFNIKDSENIVAEAILYVKENKKPALVVARGSCILVAIRYATINKIPRPTYVVIDDRCKACGICYKLFNCPAIIKQKNGKAHIDPSLCTGCSECEQICPYNAFKPSKEPDPRWFKVLRTARPIF